MPLLHIPIDFELLDGIRRLAIKLGSDRALAIAFRLWSDWARVGRDWRPLDFPVPSNCTNAPKDWTQEPLSHILEQYCQWTREGDRPGELIPLCLGAGILAVVKTGDIDGLTLGGFWRFNEHLSPLHKTMQQRGGKAKASMARMRETENLASKQVALFGVHQADLLLIEGGKATEEEIKRATALIMRLDVACDRPQRRTEDYGERLMQDALVVIRAYTFEDADTVCRFLLRNADNPEIVKEPALVLSSFSDFLRKAKSKSS
jgi:hypothetical protein